MPDEFEFQAIADEVLEEYDQNEAYKSRFIGVCQTAMKGGADKSDLIRLIENVHLTEEERTNES
jgi:hypothetical protein